MKKVVLCFVFLLCLCGCQKEIVETYSQPEVYIELNNGGTNYPILEAEIHNECDEEIYSGNDHVYTLEMYNDKEWKKIDKKCDVHKALAYVYKAKESRKISFHLKDDYGELKEGRYRIAKEFFNEDDEKINVEKEFYITPPLSIDFESSVHEEAYLASKK